MINILEMEEKLKISELKVLQSDVGYFIGTTFKELNTGEEGVYERKSIYYKTFKEAFDNLVNKTYVEVDL